MVAPLCHYGPSARKSVLCLTMCSAVAMDRCSLWQSFKETHPTNVGSSSIRRSNSSHRLSVSMAWHESPESPVVVGGFSCRSGPQRSSNIELDRELVHLQVRYKLVMSPTTFWSETLVALHVASQTRDEWHLSSTSRNRLDHPSYAEVW